MSPCFFSGFLLPGFYFCALRPSRGLKFLVFSAFFFSSRLYFFPVCTRRRGTLFRSLFLFLFFFFRLVRFFSRLPVVPLFHAFLIFILRQHLFVEGFVFAPLFF